MPDTDSTYEIQQQDLRRIMASHPDNNSPTNQTPLCEICKAPLADEVWIDDVEYGDVHTRCLDGTRCARSGVYYD